MEPVGLTEFGKKLVLLQKSLGMTHVEFSNKLGLSRYYVRSVEKGDRPISDSFFERVVKRFELSKNDIETLNVAKKISGGIIEANLKNKRPDQVALIYSILDNLDKLQVKDVCAIQGYIHRIKNRG